MTEDKQENNKRPRLELKKTFDLGKIKQNFSHGRSRSVSVEVKKKRSFSNIPKKTDQEDLEGKNQTLTKEDSEVINKQIKDSENDDLKETKEKETNLNKLINPETKDYISG